ncbi:hypothetical protein DYD21_08795 [Rhodohalobacter sp. SW132]|uniref:neuraminidase-like domain-containing protein n=1 Tax=Rhodohalobacter sp. SW132 TaxID=2293433 RepID=UPI000E237518|nr:neuraminidase-like domain-containing protein [Rhodohalobacter sp. SW132]REL37867.1 hypothetical protein DYD21_08795 [Rhodohalobacter sp. SW132]
MFQLHLIATGPNKEAVINKIAELTSKSPEESTRIVQELDMVQHNLEEREAKRLQRELTSVGAQVMLLPAGDFTLPRGKPLLLQLLDENEQPLAGASVQINTRNDQFNLAIDSAISNDEGNVSITNFSDLVTEFFEELPPFWLQVVQNDNTYKPIHQAFNWQTFSNYPETRFLVQIRSTEQRNGLKEHSVSGTVYSSRGVGVPGLKAIAVHKSLGDDVILGDGKTDEKGGYTIEYSTEDLSEELKQPDLQIKVVDPHDEEMELARSSVRYNFSSKESLNVILSPEKDPKPAPEYIRLHEALQKYTNGRKFHQLKEDDKHQDISFLANKTGWDARMIAMAVLAHEGAEQTELPPPLYYALYRAGVSTDPLELNRTNAHTARKIWKQAIDQNVIDPSFEEQLDDHMELFKKSSTETLLQDESSPGVSTLDQMLSLSLSDDNQKREFAERYLNQNPEEESFWDGIEARFGQDLKGKLQLDGKLGVLTSNNVPLIKMLRDEDIVTEDPVELVQNGLYTTSAWLTAMQDRDIPVPEDLPGETIEEKRRQYADAMAGQLKMSYPTAVLAQQVEREELSLIDEGVRVGVANFLNTHQKDFTIGQKPFLQYIKEKELDLGESEVQELKRLERVFQVSASPDSFEVLLENNIDSAHAATRIGKKGIVHKLVLAGISEEEANLVSEKILHVQSATMNVLTGYTTYMQTPPIYALNHLHPLYDREPNGEREGILAYPTLEELVGEMDFCDCKHCRSVLSPAAYLVELLQFINKNPKDFEDVIGENPLDILNQRRPDIEHIQLTCENTNTVLPYIDLVNEILEHFVVNNSLDNFHGFNIEGNISTEELLANPQFVQSEAYDIVKQQIYPFQLPFNQPLAALRRLFEHLEVPLYQAMTKLRADDNGATWTDIHLEFLGISQQEYAILTANKKKIAEYYGMSEGANLQTVLTANGTYAKDFSRTVDITYKELTRIVKTQFINPSSNLIPKLEQLRVSMNAIVGLIDGNISDAAFDNLLDDDLNTDLFDGDVKSWIRERSETIKGLVLLMDRSGKADECSFEQLEIRYADDTPIDELDYFKFMRFIRLWKKLGWTIEQTDKTIMALWSNAEDANTIEKLNDGFAALIQKVAHVRKVMELLDINPRRNLLKTLALFGTIDIHHPQSLYQTLFLNATISNIDDVFQENPSGEYLSDPDVKVIDHETAVLAALNLSSHKLRLILRRLKGELALDKIEDVPLTLDNVTFIHRYSYLSRQLKLSIEEVLLLQNLSGIDPFEGLEGTEPGIIRFIELAQNLSNSDFTIPQLTYFLRHEDLSGKASPSEKDMLEVAKQIKDELQRIENENTSISDPTGEALRSKMVQVYDQAVVDQFFSIVNNDISFEVEGYDHHVPSLESELREVTNRLSYNDFQKVLLFKGIMTSDEKDKLENEANNIPEADNARTAFIAAIESLFDQGEDAEEQFFEQYPELKNPYNSFKTNNNFEKLLNDILESFKIRVKNLAVRQTLADALSIETERTKALLNDSAVLHSVTENNDPAIEDYLALENNGVSAVYTFQDNSTEEQSLSNINTALDSHQLPDSSPLEEVAYSFYTDVPKKGFYNFRLETDDGADVSFSLDNEKVDGTNTNGIWENSEAIELEANQLHHFKIVLSNVVDKAILKWVSENGPSNYRSLPDSTLYPGQAIQHFNLSYLRFLKAVTLLETLYMTDKEIRYFSNSFKIDDSGFLNAIPVNYNSANAESLLKVIINLLQYKQIQEDLEAESEDFVAVLSDPSATYTNSQGEEESLLLKITGWDEDSFDALLAEFGLSDADLSDIKNFYRISEALRLVNTTGLPAKKLLESTTNVPDGNTVDTLQHAIRIKYDERAWLSVIQPINDDLRNIQRDALVEYVLRLLQQNEGTEMIDTVDKLFEYFLIDVAMDSCMKTSRIKQAISSVQLFIHRCLLNLEQQTGNDKGVDPAIIDSKQWEWMKRYRVWEANRKVYLHPENWLEPELRDNKSSFFKELESELLQSDITEDRARTVLLTYLEKLDEVAKLDIAGVCLQENQISKEGKYYNADDVLHIFGKTQGTGAKYYYRRFEGGYFTPWEKVDLDIEGEPILPVIWKDRLFLFWLNIIQKGVRSDKTPISGNGNLIEAEFDSSAIEENSKINVEISLSWSEYFNGEWQPRRMSDVNDPVIFKNINAEDFKRKEVKLTSNSKSSKVLNLHIYDEIESVKNWSHGFHLKNKYSASLGSRNLNYENLRSINTDNEKVNVTVEQKNQILNRHNYSLTHTILNSANTSNSVQPGLFTSPYHTPFFIQNEEHVFFVQLRQTFEPIQINPDYGSGKIDVNIANGVVITPASDISRIDIERLRDLEKVLIKDPILNNDGPGWIDPAPIKKGFIESRINKALLSEDTLLFRGRVIGATRSSDPKDIRGLINSSFNQ